MFSHSHQSSLCVLGDNTQVVFAGGQYFSIFLIRAQHLGINFTMPGFISSSALNRSWISVTLETKKKKVTRTTQFNITNGTEVDYESVGQLTDVWFNKSHICWSCGFISCLNAWLLLLQILLFKYGKVTWSR